MKRTLLAVILVLVFGSTGASAETIYLKDGKIVRGRIGTRISRRNSP